MHRMIRVVLGRFGDGSVLTSKRGIFSGEGDAGTQNGNLRLGSGSLEIENAEVRSGEKFTSGT